MKTLIFGAAGYFGRHFQQALPGSVASTTDIADPPAVAQELDRERPQVVINCAGKTGRPNVDWCEDHRLETVRGNITGPLVLLEACLNRDCYLVHLSSGCLYEGDNGGEGFAETDKPNFLGSFYSRSKAYADGILSEFPVLLLRPRMPFDDSLHDRSLIGKVAKYKRVLDAPNSFTYLPDFLRAARQLIEKRQTGIFNVVNPGASSPYQIMLRYRDIVDPDHDFERLPPSQLDEVATAARSNCILSVKKLQSNEIRMRPVADAVDSALRAIAAERE